MVRKSLCGVILIVLAILLSGAPLEAANIGKDAEGRPTWNGQPFIPRWLYDAGAAEGVDPVAGDNWTAYFTVHGLDPLFDSKAINLYIHLTTGTYDNHLRLANHLADRGIAAVAVGNQFGGATLPQFGIDNNHRYTIDPPYRRNIWEPHPGAGAVYLADEPEDAVIGNVEEWYGYYKADSPTKPKISILLHGIRDKAVIEPWAQRQTGDWLGSDPYPVGIGPNNTQWTETNGWPNWWVAENAAQVVKMANQYGKVPIMALQLNIFQGFNSNRGRFPTNNELWSHLIMAFTEGARGVGWWALGTMEYATDAAGTSTADRQRMRDMLLSMGSFLRDHEAVLVEDPVPSLITANSTHQADAKTWRLSWLNKILSTTFAGKTYDNNVWNGGMTDPLERERDRLNAGDLSWGWMLDQLGNVRTRAWLAADGTIYILSYNHDIDPVTATLTLDRTISQVEVLGDEARTVPVNADGRSFTDTWGGSHSTRQGPSRQAHIYRITGGGTPPPGPLTVTFTNPANGATVGGTITVSLAASGGTGNFTGYMVKVDGTTIFTGASSAFSWNTTSVAPGAHTLTGTVTDSAGTTASASISVTVQQPPGGPPLSVAFTNPTQGQVVSGTRAIDIWVENAIGSSNTFVTKVDGVTIDTRTIAGAHANIWPWDTTTLSDGSHSLSATVTDSAGRTATTSITVTVSNGTPLSVSFTNPTQGQVVSGTRAIDVWAANAIGSSNTFVTKVDGVTINTQTIAGPHANIWPWNTTTLSDGSHTLSATVTDAAGRTATTSITVTVSNGPPLSVSFTNPTQGQVVSGTRAIDIWVANAIGSSNTFVTKVDGVTIDTQTIAGTHANIWPWNTTTLSNGSHTLSATVTDSVGRTATTSITVTVSNP
jgi:hypothetical protein